MTYDVVDSRNRLRAGPYASKDAAQSAARILNREKPLEGIKVQNSALTTRLS